MSSYMCIYVCVYTCMSLHVKNIVQAEIYRGIRHIIHNTLKELKAKMLQQSYLAFWCLFEISNRLQDNKNSLFVFSMVVVAIAILMSWKGSYSSNLYEIERQFWFLTSFNGKYWAGKGS